MSDLNTSLLLPCAEPLERTIADRTRRFYDNIASFYPVSTFLFHRKAHAFALERSGIENGMRILEVATGSGEVFRQLVQRNPDGATIGLDLAPRMAARSLRRARKENPAAEAHCGAVDVRELPFRDASFDAVVCCYLLELMALEDIHRTLREIRRVLRPGGKFTLILIGQNRGYFNRLYTFGARILPAFWGRQMEASGLDILRKAGLRVTHDQFVQQGFYPSRVLIAENSLQEAPVAMEPVAT